MMQRAETRRTARDGRVLPAAMVAIAGWSVSATTLGNDFGPVDIQLSEVTSYSASGTYDNVGVSMLLEFESEGAGLLPNSKPMIQVNPNGGVRSWQFREDRSEGSGPVTSVYLDLVLDQVGPGIPLPTITLEEGNGDDGGADIASKFTDRIELDTGAALFDVPLDGSLWGEAWAQGLIMESNSITGLTALDEFGAVYSSLWGPSTVTLEANGPACAEVLIEGSLTDVTGTVTLVDYAVTLRAYRDSHELHGSLQLGRVSGGSFSGNLVDRVDLVSGSLAGNPSEQSVTMSMLDPIVSVKNDNTGAGYALRRRVVQSGWHSSLQGDLATGTSAIDSWPGSFDPNGWNGQLLTLSEFTLSVFDAVPSKLGTVGRRLEFAGTIQ